MIYLGIDPGVSGGWAILDKEGQPLRTEKFTCWEHIYSQAVFAGKHYDESDLAATNPLELWICLEKAQAMSRGGQKQGVTSMFTYGGNYGGWLSLLEGHQLQHILVGPQVWQKRLLGSFPKGESKPAAYSFAKRKWPSLNLAKSNTGVIDALCIALYARYEHLGIKA